MTATPSGPDSDSSRSLTPRSVGGAGRAGSAGSWALAGLAAGIVFASRLPFLFAGFGIDGDASRVFIAARALAVGGRYEVSRSFGYPLQEWVCALLWRGGPAALNGASALASAVAVFFFARVLHALGARGVIAPCLALACVPAVYISSVSAMDYLWALAFLMASLAAVLAGRPGLAGVAFALAAGCRVTSLFLLPSYMILAGGAAARLALPALAGGALFYVPVLLRYGAEITRLLDSAPVPLRMALFDATVGVWGEVGLAALAAAILSLLFWRWLPSRADPANRVLPPLERRLTAAFLLAVVLDIALYCVHPNEAAYFIAGLPFGMILLARLLDRRVFAVFCLALCVSPFVLLQGTRPAAGQILEDHARRISGLADARALIARGEELSVRSPDSLVVTGRERLPKLKALLPAEAIPPDEFWSPASNRVGCLVGSTTFVSRLTPDALAGALAARRAVFFIKEIRAENRQATGLDLGAKASGATPLAR